MQSESQDETKKTMTAAVKPRDPEPVESADDDANNLPVYDEVDEWTMDDSAKYKTPPKRFVAQEVKHGSAKHSPTTVRKEKPMARVIPSSKHTGDTRKPFNDLNNDELVERLNFCNLPDFAKFCKKEKLNGAFFKNLSKEDLTEGMNLKGIMLHKFLQMRDYNWVPS